MAIVQAGTINTVCNPVAAFLANVFQRTAAKNASQFHFFPAPFRLDHAAIHGAIHHLIVRQRWWFHRKRWLSFQVFTQPMGHTKNLGSGEIDT